MQKTSIPLSFRTVVTACFLCAAYACLAAVPDTLPPGKTPAARFFAVPLVSYSPDTYWAFGGAGIVTFRGTPVRSSVSFSLAYTTRKQVLIWFPYLWVSPAGHWRAYGEVGWYRYLYQYFGIGNRYADDYRETYTAQYPRIRLTALHRLGAHSLAGARYGLDLYHILETSAGGELAAGSVAGARGGASSSLGPAWLFDSRDNQFYPRKGWFVETTLFGEAPLLGSDFSYLRFSVDAARYFSLGKNRVIALHALNQYSMGQPPFFALPFLGGMRWLRGYPAGKFRDRHLLLLQGELRFPLFWRFKGVVFGGAGSVFGTPGEGWRWRPNAGGGLRFEFDRLQHIHLRLDYGVGKGSSGFYLTMGEAF